VKRAVVRYLVLMIGLAIAASGAWSLAERALAANTEAGKIELNSDHSSPRPIEDTTHKNVIRDYGAAWQTLGRALYENRAAALASAFTGVAQEKLSARIEAQQKAGTRVKITDRSHKVNAVFYSPEGSAIQLQDVADIEIQYLKGDDVVHRENLQQKYLVLLTMAEGNWNVRLMEEVPEF
jgi:Cu/Ag efflux pump CusA